MSWMKLCSLEEMAPGSMKIVPMEGTEFLVLCSNEESFLVIPPSCPHMATCLAEGFFDGDYLTCAKHLWQWAAADGSAQGIAEAPLKVYQSKAMDGALYVDFEQELRYHYEAEA